LEQQQYWKTRIALPNCVLPKESF